MARSIRQRLGSGLGVLVGLVVVTVILMSVICLRCLQAFGEIDRTDGLASEARSLGIFAREQYIHEAHTIILGDRSHVEHQEAWVARLHSRADALARRLAPSERAHLQQIEAQSAALQSVFADEILPAIDRHDVDAVRAAHERAESDVASMIEAADGLGERLDAQSRDTVARVDRESRYAMLLGAAIALVGSVLAAWTARRAWSAVASPLGQLGSVVERVTSGDLRARVGALDAKELDAVGRAFDAMLDRLQRREAELVRADRLATLGRVASGVAHEINNPIAVIRGYLATMIREATAPTLQRELEILDEEAVACQRIAEDLLAYARVPMIDVQPTKIESLVHDVLERIGTTGDLGECAVKVHVADAVLSIDPVRIRQVLTNLLRNAAQSTDGHGEIDVLGATEGDLYVITISDRGPGLPPESRAHLFEPFTTSRKGGTGLGLAVCHGIIGSHGGEIDVIDREGGGSSFRIKLPIDDRSKTAAGER